jgi:serine/threonine-protein kinase
MPKEESKRGDVGYDSPTLGPTGSAQHAEPGWPVQNWDLYQFVSYIGEGGMGRVFKAYDPQLKRHVALKFLRGDDPSLKERFLREAQAQASVNHENVCKIFDAGEVNNLPYIAMQFIDGFTLNRIPHELTVEEKVKIIREVADGIHAAHRVGLIHRDIKPGNVMVERNEDGLWNPYILDFGLVRGSEAKGITVTGMVIGTPGYMAPEQAFNDEDHPIDRRADIYSLGATLYEVVSGHALYEGTSSMDILKRMVESDPISLHVKMPDVPEDLETIVMKCLEREPHRRYESARSFSDDLGRYLNGEPIIARRSTIAYKVYKKALKHKAMTATLVVFTLALFGVLAFAIQSRLQASKQAAAAQRFGMEVERIEGVLQRIRTLPLHDVRAEEQSVRERIRWVSQQMRNGGKPAEGPGLHAIGRIHLELQEYEKAREALQRAWDRGYRQPEVSYALGLTLGHLYQNELIRLEQIGNKEEREARQKQIEVELRDPAVRNLQLSRGRAFESPEYAEALIAFYGSKYDEALNKTIEAFRQFPWMYEAKILEGEIHRSKGSAKGNTGDYDGANADFKKAEAAFAQSIRIGRSDASSYQGMCGLFNRKMHMDLYRGSDFTSYIDAALEPCSQAIEINANLPEAFNGRSQIYRFKGEFQLMKGVNPMEALQNSASEAERAISLDPKNVEAYGKLGTAYSLMGEYESMRDKSPEPFLKKAEPAYLKAIELAPRDVFAYHNLGLNHQIIGTFQRNHGIPDRASFEKAIHYESKAIEIMPTNAFPYNGLGIAYSNLGGLDIESGKDPRKNLDQAWKYLKKVTELNKNSPYAFNNVASIVLQLAEWEENHGIDSLPHLNDAMAAAETALKLQADHTYAFYNAGKIQRAFAQLELKNGKSPEKFIESSVKFLEDGIRNNNTIAGPHDELATSLLVRAEYELSQGKSPENTIREAEQWIAKSVKLGPTRSAGFVARGDAEILKARWLMFKKQDPSKTLNRARDAYSQAIQKNERDRNAFIGLARTQMMLARNSSADQRHGFIQDGLSSADRALSVAPDTAVALAIKSKLLELKGDAAAALAALDEAKKINSSIRVDAL